MLRLKAEPEIRVCIEGFRYAQCHVRGDARFSIQNARQCWTSHSEMLGNLSNRQVLQVIREEPSRV